METKSHNISEQTLHYGLITGGVISLYLLILFAVNLLTWSSIFMVKLVFSAEYLFLMAGMLWAVLQIRKQTAEQGMTYGRAFLTMLMTGIYAGLVASIFIFIWSEFIQPDLKETIIARLKDSLQTLRPELSDKGYSDIMNFAKRFSTPAMEFSMSLIYYIKISAIFALIAAAFIRKGSKKAAL
jgi:hypothetical protein